MSCGCVRPIVCPAQYVVRDYYTPQVVPVIQPVVTVNRQNIVNVPQYYVQQLTTDVVVPPQTGFPAMTGATGRRFF